MQTGRATYDPKGVVCFSFDDNSHTSFADYAPAATVLSQRWEKQYICDDFGDSTGDYMYCLNGQKGTYSSSYDRVDNASLDWALFFHSDGSVFLLLLEEGNTKKDISAIRKPDDKLLVRVKTDNGKQVTLKGYPVRNASYYNVVSLDSSFRKYLTANTALKVIISTDRATYNLGTLWGEDFLNVLGIWHGPAGGWVFYDKGYYSDGWRYLEAAPEDLPGLYPWGTAKGYTSAYVGNSHANLAQISETDENGALTASAACKAYSVAEIKDWQLPTKDELALMYEHLAINGIGGFDLTGFSSAHWSSTAGNGETAWFIYFSDGSLSTTSCEAHFAVRPVRAF